MSFIRSVHTVTRCSLNKGFSLIELMIGLTVVVIVVSLAVPSYQNYVIRSSRTEAMETLLATASCQERIYTLANAYDASACEGNTSNNKYTITVSTSNSNQSFVATAAPQGSQTDDNCGSLTISQTGVKTAAGEGGSFARGCWSGKYASTSGG